MLEKLSFHLELWRIQELRTLTFPALKILTASATSAWGVNDSRLGEFLKNQRPLEQLTLGSMRLSAIQGVSGGVGKLHLGSRMSTDQKMEFWFKPEVLEGFQCLLRLSLVERRDAVDDQLMQWLLKAFPPLEEFLEGQRPSGDGIPTAGVLHLSDCSTVTDAGISGKTTAEWERDASFADLRRLQTLKIVRCPGVTPNEILASCVNVRSLRSLEYSNPPGHIVESVVLKMVERNPRLETLSLRYAGDVGELGKLKAKVLKKNPLVEFALAEEDDE